LKLRGQTPARHVDSGVTLVKKSDLDRTEIRALLYPDIEKYLVRKR
jgi:hypothetical protein